MVKPEEAIPTRVPCVDEKSRVQAIERTQPVLPMGWGYLEGVTHDYSHQKPERRALECNSRAIERWKGTMAPGYKTLRGWVPTTSLPTNRAFS